MTNINDTTKNTIIAKEPGLRQVVTAVAFALAPFVVVLVIAAMYVAAVNAYSNTATCSTDFRGNVICRTTW